MVWRATGTIPDREALHVQRQREPAERPRPAAHIRTGEQRQPIHRPHHDPKLQHRHRRRRKGPVRLIQLPAQLEDERHRQLFQQPLRHKRKHGPRRRMEHNDTVHGNILPRQGPHVQRGRKLSPHPQDKPAAADQALRLHRLAEHHHTGREGNIREEAQHERRPTGILRIRPCKI